MASDVQDILGIQRDSTPKPTKRPTAKLEREKRPDGLNREIIALTGGVPPLAQALPAVYKEKPNLNKRVTSWEWKSFTNPARTDGLVLQHWMRADWNNDGGLPFVFRRLNFRPTDNFMADYYFAKYNKPVTMINYTDEEYNKYLNGTTHRRMTKIRTPDSHFVGDPTWSREETDYLYQLCRQFDLRFIIIADRYEYPGSERTIEDLRDRYYSNSRKLIAARQTNENPRQYDYSKEKEKTRKEHLAQLYARTPEQIKEEEYLFTELRRREHKEERMAKERENLLRLIRKNEIEPPPS
ncbi:swr complex subunit, partial [Rhizophlyctis rosea]